MVYFNNTVVGSEETHTRLQPIRPFSGASLEIDTLLTFRHCASCILGQAFHYSPENAFIYLINKYISLSDICLTVYH